MNSDRNDEQICSCVISHVTCQLAQLSALAAADVAVCIGCALHKQRRFSAARNMRKEWLFGKT